MVAKKYHKSTKKNSPSSTNPELLYIYPIPPIYILGRGCCAICNIKNEYDKNQYELQTESEDIEEMPIHDKKLHKVKMTENAKHPRKFDEDYNLYNYNTNYYRVIHKPEPQKERTEGK